MDSMRNRFPLYCIAAVLFFAAGCDGTNLFDQLATTTIDVNIKGTFESNYADPQNPRAWNLSVLNDDSMVYVSPNQAKKSRNDNVNGADIDTSITGGYDQFPSEFKIDIAELYIDGKKLANYRQTFCQKINDASDPFFNGTGVSYRCDDVKKNKAYSTINLYIRKMLFGNANEYNLETDDAAYLRTPQTKFNEETQYGYDINQDYVWAFWDNLREDLYYINRIFPVDIPIVEGFESDSTHQSVIEIRVVVKNFIKRFEIFKEDDLLGINAAYHVFGLSDWLRDARPYRSSWLGGNIIAVARGYYTDSVGTITGSTGSIGYKGAVVVAIPETEVSSLTTYYEYGAKPEIADSYAAVAPTVPPYTGTSVGFGVMNYLLELQRYNYDKHNEYYNHVVDETTSAGYAATWDAYNNAYNNYRLPPLATMVDENGNYTLTNVPVDNGIDGKTHVYRMYISTQSSTPSTAIPASPVAGELPYGWKARSSDTAVTVVSAGSVTTANF